MNISVKTFLLPYSLFQENEQQKNSIPNIFSQIKTGQNIWLYNIVNQISIFTFQVKARRIDNGYAAYLAKGQIAQGQV